ncbi:MAG: sulfotransferase, partial [Acidobacteria bacterium]|nr:sulfotransferase [Acidobacteriota bacterium]
MSKPNRLAFITGCGRSGTTILGEILSHHEGVQYLNDRFDLWVETFPVADIWGKGHGEPVPGAKIALTPEDCQFPEGAGVRQKLLSKLAAERNGKPLLISKLAINNFRLCFLHYFFPVA